MILSNNYHELEEIIEKYKDKVSKEIIEKVLEGSQLL